MAKVDELHAARDACLTLVDLCGAFLLFVRDFYRWSDSAQELLATLDEIKHREYARAEPFLSLFVELDNAQPLARQAFEKVRLNLLAVAADRCAHQQIIEQADTILKVAGSEFGIGGRIAERDAGRTLAGMMSAMLWSAWDRDAWPEIDVEAARQRIEVEHAKAIAVSAPMGEGKPVDDRQPVVEVKPKVYLSGWPDILDAVGRKNSQTEKNSVLGLNERFDGPIPKVGKGSKPLVEKSTLLNWWNGLEDRFREIDAAQKNKAATVAEQYQYGRDATVVPGIAGHEKKSRSKKG